MSVAKLFAALLGLGIVLAAPAQATEPADTEFLGALEQAKIHFTTPDEAIAYGHRICQALSDNRPDDDILALMMADNPTLLEWQAGALLGASVAAYCPKHDGV